MSKSTHSSPRSSSDSQRTINEKTMGTDDVEKGPGLSSLGEMNVNGREKELSVVNPSTDRTTPTSAGATSSGQKSNDQPITKTRTALDWEGPDDPENPMNWSLALKWYHVMVVGMQSFTVSFGTSVYTPAVDQVIQHFGVSHTAALVPLTVYVLGLAFGPMISAPVSETWGRRPIYQWMFPISLFFSLGASRAQSFGTLIACRLLAGLIGSGALAVGGGTTADMFVPAQRAPAGAAFILWPFLGPAFGPCVGSFAAQYKSWRWPLYTILMLGAASTVFAIPMRETHKRILLERRAKKLGLPAPPSPLPPGLKARLKVILLITFLRPIRMLLTEPIVAFLSLYTAFNFAILFAFFAVFPVVFRSPFPDMQIYHFGLGESGLVFIAISLGCLIATAFYIWMDRREYQAKVAASSLEAGPAAISFTPEERMKPAMIGCFLLPIGLFWFAWTCRASIHWIVPVIATVFFGIGNLLVFDSTIMYLIDAYGAKEGASASAANGLLRYIAGAVFPLFMVQFVHAAGVGWTVSTLAFVTVLLCPIPWILRRWGHQIRQRSAYAPTP